MSLHIKNPKSTFIHIPKTGGTSISTWLKNAYGVNYNKGFKHAGYEKMEREFGDLGFTYTVVRNPWDRVVSAYFYYKGKNSRIVKSVNGMMSFKEYANDVGKALIMSQQSLATDKINLVLKFENLQEDFKQIQKFYGIKKPLGKKNTTKHEHYSKYYENDDYLINKIGELYALDIKRYNYDFEYK